MAEKTLVYQLYPISWGSIRMMTLFLPRIVALGADYVCLCPIFRSPWKNSGYDVSDYYNVEPRLGTMADFDEFIESAHAMGLKVILDLPIDSTSVEHDWFITENHSYIIKKGKLPSFTRKNFYGDNLVWQKSGNDAYYFAPNHPTQAALDWFSNGILNRGLVECFRTIMSFWISRHGVDGFRIEFAQLINANPEKETGLDKLLVDQRAVTVINRLSNNLAVKAPFLIMDCINPDGKTTNFYSRATDVEFITDQTLRNVAVANVRTTIGIKRKITASRTNPKFMLSLESHDTPRLTTRSGLSGRQILETMFRPNVRAVCLYQGQELGLQNPELSIQEILRLDPRMGLNHEVHNISNEILRRESCANARVPLPLSEYARQETDPESVLASAIAFIQEWKRSKS